MVMNPFVILFELIIGVAQQEWDTITFTLSKLWEFLVSLSYYSSQNLPIAILSAVFASIVTYFVLKYLFKRTPIKLILTVALGIIVIAVILILLGSIFL